MTSLTLGSFHELGSSDLIDLDAVIDQEQRDQAIDHVMIELDL
jgi:hypothetical protein